MYSYSVTQWVMFFYMYCFFGWIFESTYVSIKNRHFVNRGFMHGPLLPLYGSGAIIVLFVAIPLNGNYIAQYFAGAVAATALEYVTGVVMEALFKVRYWDYSNQRFNVNGHICLSSSIAWGFLTLFLVNVIHKPVERILLWLHPEVCSVLALVITVAAAADFTTAFKEAMQLRELLFYFERAKEEFDDMKTRLSKRVDVVAAVVDDGINQSVGKIIDKKDSIVEKGDTYMDKIKAKREKMFKNMLYKYPTLHSDRFSDIIDELKNARFR